MKNLKQDLYFLPEDREEFKRIALNLGVSANELGRFLSNYSRNSYVFFIRNYGGNIKLLYTTIEEDKYKASENRPIRCAIYFKKSYLFTQYHTVGGNIL